MHRDLLFIHFIMCYTFAHPLQVKKTLEALRQRHEEEAAHSEISQKAVEQGRSGTSQEKWETEQRGITAELLKLKDRLIDVEKNVRSHFRLVFLLIDSGVSF